MIMAATLFCDYGDVDDCDDGYDYDEKEMRMSMMMMFMMTMIGGI